MAKVKRSSHVLYIFIVVLLSLACIITMFAIVCRYIDEDDICFLNKFFEKNRKSSDEFYISSFINLRDREEQKLEAFVALHRAKEELEELLKWIEDARATRDEYIRVNGRLKLIFYNMLFLFSGKDNDSVESYARRVTDRLYNKVKKALNTDEKSYVGEYRRILGILFDRKRMLEDRISELTDFLLALEKKNNDRGALVSDRETGSSFAFDAYASDSIQGSLTSIRENAVENRFKKDVKGPVPAEKEDEYSYNFRLKVIASMEELRSYLNERKKAVSEYTDKLKTAKNLKSLFKQAEYFTKNGQYKKAAEIYRNILVFDLSPSDREIVVDKLQSVHELFVKTNQKRKQNREVIELLGIAERYEAEGAYGKANSIYKRIVKEYRMSDFCDRALERLIKNLKSD